MATKLSGRDTKKNFYFFAASLTSSTYRRNMFWSLERIPSALQITWNELTGERHVYISIIWGMGKPNISYIPAPDPYPHM